MESIEEYISLSDSAVRTNNPVRAAGYAKLAELLITNKLANATIQMCEANIEALKNV